MGLDLFGLPPSLNFLLTNRYWRHHVFLVHRHISVNEENDTARLKISLNVAHHQHDLAYRRMASITGLPSTVQVPVCGPLYMSRVSFERSSLITCCVNALIKRLCFYGRTSLQMFLTSKLEIFKGSLKRALSLTTWSKRNGRDGKRSWPRCVLGSSLRMGATEQCLRLHRILLTFRNGLSGPLSMVDMNIYFVVCIIYVKDEAEIDCPVLYCSPRHNIPDTRFPITSVALYMALTTDLTRSEILEHLQLQLSSSIPPVSAVDESLLKEATISEVETVSVYKRIVVSFSLKRSCLQSI